MYRIAICEDDEKYIHFLEKVIVSTKSVEEKEVLFYSFPSGESLLNDQYKDWDLVILDLQLGGIGGYEIAKYLREYDRRLLLVFCSGVYEPTTESFKVAPYRYLQKRFLNDKMIDEMKEILEEMKARKSYPSIMCKYSTHIDKIRVYPDAILYVAIKNETTQVYVCGKLKEQFPNEVLRANLNISEVCEIFNEQCGFVRIHNSYAVNMSYIVETHKDSVKLADGTELTVSRSRAREFKAIFARYLAAKYKGK